MSIVNLAGNLMRPEYPFMYIVGSKSLDDFQIRYKCTVVTVGRIEEPGPESHGDKSRVLHLGLMRLFGFLGGIALDLLIVGLMTRFTKGQSTHAQRVWIVIWLVFGAFYGFYIHDVQTGQTNGPKKGRWRSNPLMNNKDFFRSVNFCFYGAPTIGGFVVVAQMIKQYGVCSKILDVGV